MIRHIVDDKGGLHDRITHEIHLRPSLLLLHPVGDGESDDSLEGSAEGVVTVVATPFCQSECGDGTVFLSCFAIEMDEVVDTLAVCREIPRWARTSSSSSRR